MKTAAVTIIVSLSLLVAPAAAQSQHVFNPNATEVAGVPVYSHFDSRYWGAFAGDHILLRPWISGRLSKGAVQYGLPKRRIAMAIYVLAHEMGHKATKDREFVSVELYEKWADNWAYWNYRRVAKDLGASDSRIKSLIYVLPWPVR